MPRRRLFATLAPLGTPRAWLCAATLLASAGCHDDRFLTETPIDFVAPTNFYHTRDDALAAVNGIYAAFVATSSFNYYGLFFPMLVEFPTEMQTPRLNATNERSLLDNYSFTPSHTYIYQAWANAYTAINRANGVIGHVPAIAMDTTLRSRIVGEAKFLRALHYFNLVRLFGGVPLQTAEVTSIDSLQTARNTAAEVYAQIVADLQDASKVLPRSYTGADIGRATRGAARTLLAKVYLQRAGTGVSTTPGADDQAALTLLRDVDATGGYSLVATYSDLFDGRHETNPEVIFDIQCIRAPGLGCKLSSQLSPPNANYGNSRQGGFSAEWPFFKEFALADKRRAATWQLSYVNRANQVIRWDSTQTAKYGNDTPFMHKFLDSLSVGDDENNYIILRYGDNLLMEAEAINELAGPTADAYAAIDRVRRRAGIGDLVPGLSKQAFKDSVFHERRLELSMEGPHGFFDSQRDWAWARARVEANMALGKAASFRTSRYPKAQVAITDKFKLFPIPQRAIDLDHNLTQNPGW